MNNYLGSYSVHIASTKDALLLSGSVAVLQSCLAGVAPVIRQEEANRSHQAHPIGYRKPCKHLRFKNTSLSDTVEYRQRYLALLSSGSKK
jgi:hypothetical protein